MAKRSPILGYNHNVRYRGLVFHVQTEDSGVMSPHLFTHLFHEGVIVSTHKLVYDASSGEEAIKSLMQAQHKRVMKELKKGGYDDKIDAYLVGTEGLLPRVEVEVEEATPALVAPAPPVPAPPGEPPAPAVASPVAIERPEPSEVIELTSKARTKTAERTSKSPPVRTALPPPPGPQLDGPTIRGDSAGSVAAAVLAANAATVPNAVPRPLPNEPASGAARPARTSAAPSLARPPAAQRNDDAIPELDLALDDDPGERPRRDTAISDVVFDTAVPLELVDDATRRSYDDSVPPVTAKPQRRHDRPPSHGASALPPMSRPPSRPAMTPPPIVSRPVIGDSRRRADSEAVEIYAAAPPSADAPPGERSERPGQYSVARSRSGPNDVPMRERTGRIAIPTELSRSRTSSAGMPAQVAPGRTSAVSAAPPIAPVPPKHDAKPSPVPDPPRPSGPRTTAAHPIRGAPATNSGVVMTRPAMIVGAPKGPPPTPPPRVRKAREEEGRGFGQGLISEKSLDEVILAYLSEDAEEK